MWPDYVILHSGRTVTMTDVREFCRAEAGEFIGLDACSQKRFRLQCGRIRYSISLESVEAWKLRNRRYATQ